MMSSRKEEQVFWVHEAAYTYSLEEPERYIETLWVARDGWGYIRRRDLWLRREGNLDRYIARGFRERRPLTDPEVHICPGCGMYIGSVPGSLTAKHFLECGGDTVAVRAIEESLISEQRTKRYQAKLLQAKELLEKEAADQERKDRFDKAREEANSRQQSKDRKKKIKDQARKELREK
ncbi:MAG: hypothetical protein V2B18_25755 [Pseudomonadota bacterium]